MKREEANKLKNELENLRKERDNYKGALVSYRDVFKTVASVFRGHKKRITDLTRELSGYHLAEDIFRDQKNTRTMNHPDSGGCETMTSEAKVMSQIDNILHTGQVSNVKH